MSLIGWCQCVQGMEHRHRNPCDTEVFYVTILKLADGTEQEVLWCGSCSDLHQNRETRKRLSQ